MPGIGVQSDMSMFSKAGIAVPGMTPSLTQGADSTKWMANYRVRVQRFVIDGEELGDLAMLENLWSVGMDPSQDAIVILSNKEFTHNDVLIIVVTFLEHKTKKVNWRLGSTSVAATADDLIKAAQKGTTDV